MLCRDLMKGGVCGGAVYGKEGEREVEGGGSGWRRKGRVAWGGEWRETQRSNA